MIVIASFMLILKLGAENRPFFLGFTHCPNDATQPAVDVTLVRASEILVTEGWE